jgi:hypothetical protein
MSNNIKTDWVVFLRQMFQFIFIIIYTFITLYINCISQIYTQYRINSVVNMKVLSLSTNQNLSNQTLLDVVNELLVLPDIGFDFIPYMTPIYVDYFIYFFILLTLFRFCFTHTNNGYQINFRFLRQHILCMGTLYLLRAFSIYSTILPNPLVGCKTDVTLDPRIEAFRLITYQTTTCADVLFSGHTIHITLCALGWHHYSDDKSIINKFNSLLFWPLKYITTSTTKIIIWLFAIIGYIYIICSHFHYTIDVYIGVLLTILIYELYNVAKHTTYFHNTCIGDIIYWLEHA